ncbi:MAG: low temperature requirement protein A [bacterium]
MTGVLESVRAHLYPTDDSHRVTNLELFFDLVFVFAITNLTQFMEHDVGGTTVLEGIITLALIWFGWCAYTWLGNAAKADEGLLRLAMILAMASMFFVAISVPYAFDESSNAAVVLAVAYCVVRLTHLCVYLIVAGDDHQLRSVVLGMLAVAAVALVVLVTGAVIGGGAQKWWWLTAVTIDQLGVYFVRSTRWRLTSASHFAERFGLIVLIAIGESVVGVGLASSTPELTVRVAIALVAGLAIAVALWWLYFDVVALVAEEVLRASSGVRRARLARDSYTYIHLPMVGGIVFTAMGLVLLIEDHGHIDAGRYALYGGIAAYLIAHLLFRWRNIGSINRGRAVVAVLLLIALPVMGGLSPLGQLAVPAVLLVGLISYEVHAFREPRERVRHRVPMEESPA